MTILIDFFLVVEVLVCAMILLLVLMQRPKSEGLGTAFGSGMTGDIFGAQATNVLQKATRWLGGAFFVVALLLSMLTSKNARLSSTSSTQFSKTLSALPEPKPAREVDVNIDKKMTAEEIKELMIKKAQEKGLPVPGGANPATGTNAAPAGSNIDVSIPANQVMPIPQTQTSAPAVDLQTGTATTADPEHTGYISPTPSVRLQTGTAPVPNPNH